ncbi:hypothetical protein C8R47DRAFT_157385 [Mycena vitilis]|nr:hypothetical protein C8R47DRAFT_157385 [Mycena vitilis]
MLLSSTTSPMLSIACNNSFVAHQVRHIRHVRQFRLSAPSAMRKELQGRLQADYPILFQEGCSCDIGDGWEPVLRRLCADLHHNKAVHFVQIKEKFGGLRVYTDTYPPEVNKRLDEAEDESFLTCEECGKDGRIATTDSGWVFTACQDCLVRRIAEGRSCSYH